MIKKIKENIVFKNKYYTVFNDEVEYQNTNAIGTHVKMTGTNEQDGIAVLPVLSNGNILLIKNYRYSADSFLYQVVKGGNGTKFTTTELALQCVKEELEEEANKISDEIVFVGAFYESPSILTTKGQAFLALNCKEVEDKQYYQEETECIDSVIEIHKDDIEEFIKTKRTCSTTLLLLSEYRNYLLKNNL